MSEKNKLQFKFYANVHGEDAEPYIDDQLIVVADGLGGSGSSIHNINEPNYPKSLEEIRQAAYGEFYDSSDPIFQQFLDERLKEIFDGNSHTSAFWASRIVIGRYIDKVKQILNQEKKSLADETVRQEISSYVKKGLTEIKNHFNFNQPLITSQLLLPTTLASMHYQEEDDKVKVEVIWAGDSRCYVLTPDGLKNLSIDDEDKSGAITNLFAEFAKETKLNYCTYEISKPCVLLAVSDGVFDPFTPNENFLVECQLLSRLYQADSLESLKNNLEQFYQDIHQDDTTMAFVAFGFNDYNEIKEKLKDRIEKLTQIYQQYRENTAKLEVVNQFSSSNDAEQYIRTRTNDKYREIKTQIIENIEDETISTLNFLKTIQDDFNKNVSNVELKTTEDEITKEKEVENEDIKVESPSEVSPSEVSPSEEKTEAVSSMFEKLKEKLEEYRNKQFYYDNLFTRLIKNEIFDIDEKLQKELKMAKYLKENARNLNSNKYFDQTIYNADIQKLKNLFKEKSVDGKLVEALFNFLETDSLLFDDDNFIENIFSCDIDSKGFVKGLIYNQDKHKEIFKKEISKDKYVNSDSNDLLIFKFYKNTEEKVLDNVASKPENIEKIFSHNIIKEIMSNDFVANVEDNKKEETKEVIEDTTPVVKPKTAEELHQDFINMVNNFMNENSKIVIDDLVEWLKVHDNTVLDKNYNTTRLKNFRIYFQMKSGNCDDFNNFKEAFSNFEAEYSSLLPKR